MHGLPSREPVDEVLQMPPSLLTCGGCQQNIGDRYFLKAIDQYWHEDCLSCGGPLSGSQRAACLKFRMFSPEHLLLRS